MCVNANRLKNFYKENLEKTTGKKIRGRDENVKERERGRDRKRERRGEERGRFKIGQKLLKNYSRGFTYEDKNLFTDLKKKNLINRAKNFLNL